jgi:DNA-binding beta-propeller fold protein YncE
LAGCGGEVPRYAGDEFQSDPPSPGPMGETIVVCDPGGDTLSVIDPSHQQMLWQIPVGFIPVEIEGPHDVAADPGGSFFYVTLSEAVTGSGGGPHGSHGTGTIPGYVLKFDARDGRMAATCRLSPTRPN